MGPTVLLLTLTLASMSPERDAAARARELYNQHQYDEAIKAADDARRIPGSADVASLILGRAYLERFRDASDATDLSQARAALRSVDATKLAPRDSVELMIGLGELLYFDGQFGAAAELFDLALAAPAGVAGAARDGLLDWWADSLDHHALTAASREGAYARMLRRMEEEARRDPGSMSAAYWLVVAARGVGDLDHAWNAAIVAWVKAPQRNRRSAELRADLDRYVSQVLIPERAKGPVVADETARAKALHTEWDTLKQQWGDP